MKRPPRFLSKQNADADAFVQLAAVAFSSSSSTRFFAPVAPAPRLDNITIQLAMIEAAFLHHRPPSRRYTMRADMMYFTPKHDSFARAKRRRKTMLQNIVQPLLSAM